MTKQTKIAIGITAIGVIGLIVALKYFRGKSGSSNTLPQNTRTAGAGSLGSDIPIATPQAITEAAYNQAASDSLDPIDSPSSVDEGVLTLQ